MAQDPLLARLFANNAQWAVDVERTEPGFFARGTKGQSPKVLWIGCADSRVPESVLTVSKPGDIFVHRNVANQVHLHDDNTLAVLTYAIHTVGVEHVVIVGHTHCGGAAACHAKAQEVSKPGPPETPLERFLAPLLKLAQTGLSLPELIIENVHIQVQQAAQSEPLTQAWKEGKDVQLHGWLYELESGRLRDLGITARKEDFVARA